MLVGVWREGEGNGGEQRGGEERGGEAKGLTRDLCSICRLNGRVFADSIH